MESNLKQKNYQNFETNDNALKNNNFNDDNFQNINDDFDYEKIQAILEEVSLKLKNYL
jgi:tRNA U34 5-carboxymethylaminomethyl modifying enzyme MnmG/GidA